MREQQVDLWADGFDVRCITTNMSLKSNGAAIMGAGCAREAVERFPGIDLEYAALLGVHGHHVFLMRNQLVMFPVKYAVHENAKLDLIRRSCVELKRLAEIYGWRDIALPRPGSGLGGLDWAKEVKPAIRHLLDARFVIVSYPK